MSAKGKRLVEEKAEGKGTAAKAGLFWGLLAALPFVVAKRRGKKKKRWPFGKD